MKENKKAKMIEALQKGFHSIEELATLTGASKITASILLHTDLKRKGINKEVSEVNGVKKYKIVGVIPAEAPKAVKTPKAPKAKKVVEEAEEVANGDEGTQEQEELPIIAQPVGKKSKSIWDE